MSRAKTYVWGLVSNVPALLLLIAFASLALFSFSFDKELWTHVSQHLIQEAVSNTLFLLGGTLALSFLLGVSAAYAVVFLEFPWRRIIEKLLALPLAMPGYVLAFIWIGSLDYAGPFQTFLRENLGLHQFDLSVRNPLGVIVVMAISLYPYVYFLAKEAFRSQSHRITEAAQSLGLSKKEIFFRVTLPYSRPWILAGLSLVALECLADFGVSMAFNFQTWTVLIYRTWFDHFSLSTSAQLCLLQLISIFLLLMFVQRIRKKGHYVSLARFDLKEKTSFTMREKFVSAAFIIFLFLVLGLPLWQLTQWTLIAWRLDLIGVMEIERVIWQTFGIAFLTSSLILGFSLFSASYSRFFRSPLLIKRLQPLSLFGYAVPGTVLAVAFLVSLTWLMGPLAQWPLLSLSVMSIVLMVRYYSVSFRPIESAYERISPQLDEASVALGVKGQSLFQRIHWPLLSPASASAFLLVFMDIAKEMPIQVMLRPFGWDSLSIKIFHYTAEGQWEAAAVPALFLVLLSFAISILLKPSIELTRKVWRRLVTRERLYAVVESRES